MAEPPPKRRRLSGDKGQQAGSSGAAARPAPTSLTQPISPPRKRRNPDRVLLPSPFRLTTIRDLPPDHNRDAVSLGDLLGDPLIAECWEFNFLHDVDFLMSHFDPDTRSLVKVHLVHGFWKREDPNRLMLEEQAARHENVTLHTAYMPEPFGTHHTKMLILLRHDDAAQVIIHTANMIVKDWTNMTNGVWQSPLLPRLPGPPQPQPPPPPPPAPAGGPKSHDGSAATTAGCPGAKFKSDLLSYLRAYNGRRDVCGALVGRLAAFDFSAVRAVLVASVPGRHDVDAPPGRTRWGWPGLREALRTVPLATTSGSETRRPEIVVQVSSIATLGATDAWLQRTLFDALAPPLTTPPVVPGRRTATITAAITAAAAARPAFRVVFPTADEIRRSLDGYASGASIHTRTQSAQQAKQLRYLRPLLRHWANDCERGVPTPRTTTTTPTPSHDAFRRRAAPHIKTYVRYSGGSGGGGGTGSGTAAAVDIDWALLTSANISKQAWGEAASSAGQVRIASWEVGVLVWPALLLVARGHGHGGGGGSGSEDDRGGRDNGDDQPAVAPARMVATFGTDIPSAAAAADLDGEGGEGARDGRGGGRGRRQGGPVVGLRIPYSLPLQRYGDDEVPWVASAVHDEPDWKGASIDEGAIVPPILLVVVGKNKGVLKPDEVKSRAPTRERDDDDEYPVLQERGGLVYFPDCPQAPGGLLILMFGLIFSAARSGR
ncbi:tyrosyl-DNA phosphodiesterase [Xylariaceae sp. FL0804]|nr:tyrosyl-DNA phosphodiesterase [Xylariaceae sp. FL0804]